MELSKNYEKEVSRREKPSCYGKFDTKSKDKKTAKECGTCWFVHHCRSNKRIGKPVLKPESKAE